MPGARCPRGRRSRKGVRKNEKVHNRLTFQCRPSGWSSAVGQPDPPKIIATLKEKGEAFQIYLLMMFPIHHVTDKVSIFIMTSTKFPNLGLKSFQLKKSLFHDQAMALPQSALDWTLQIVWILFDPQALWKFWGIVDCCPLLEKMSKLAKDWQKLSNTVKHCQKSSNTVRYTAKCCLKL